jgi:formate dehydrogenase iron-sulfur subunit
MAVGFFTDTTICIGCKACEVACKQWNQLPDDGLLFTGMSYDNTAHLGASTWRHVSFVERPVPLTGQETGLGNFSWLMMSDVCKHCVNAPCLEVCPTGAILRTEFDTVYINEPACNGCRDCVTACPFGVIHMSPTRLVAQKCTFCYDRLKEGLTPACAQACPTQSIRFGKVADLKRQAETRVAQLQGQGVKYAYLYGADDKVLGGLNAFYLLVDKPEVYGLPSAPRVPSRSVPLGSLWSILAGLLTALGVLFTFRERTKRNQPPAEPAQEGRS